MTSDILLGVNIYIILITFCFPGWTVLYCHAMLPSLPFSILVGAPKGKFPGGIAGLEYGYRACAENLNTEDMTTLMATTQAERANCLSNFTFGLVYRCEMSASDCGALIGNGDEISPDGYLFERSGMYGLWEGAWQWVWHALESCLPVLLFVLFWNVLECFLLCKHVISR